MIVDLSTFRSSTGPAKLVERDRYTAAVLEAVPAGAEVTLTGPAPVWLYLAVGHALHGQARRLLYDSPVTGIVVIFDHDPH